jgi:malonyl-CoA O-methyltransferase
MEDRLGWITRHPKTWVNWAPQCGGQTVRALLQQRYPKAQSFAVTQRQGSTDLQIEPVSKPWWHPERWRSWGKSGVALPAQGVDMLWANMALHMSAQPQDLIAQWHRLLAVDGCLMFSCLGPDTLRELRAVYQGLGWPEPAHAFTDMHDWGDMLVHAGFAEPVMDMERITLSFQTPERLLQELRELGRNLHTGRFPSLRGKGWLSKLHHALQAQLSRLEEGGQLCLSFEIVYGHAFKPAPRLGVAPQTVVSLDEMRQALAAGKSRQPSP